MMEIVEEEYQQFLQDMEDGSLVFGRYINEAEYEDETHTTTLKKHKVSS